MSNPLDNTSSDDLTDIVNSGKLSELANAIRNTPNPPAPDLCVKSNENQGQERSERSEACIINNLQETSQGSLVDKNESSLPYSESKTSSNETAILTPQRASGFDIKDPVELL